MSSNIRYTDITARNNILCIKNLYFCIIITITVALSIVIGLLLYEELPNQVALQWGLNLEVTRSALKTKKLIYFIPAIQLINGLIIVMCNVIIKKSKLSLVRASKKDVESILAKKYLMSKLIFFTVLMTEIIYTVVQLIIFSQELTYLILIIVLLIVMICIIGYYVRKIPKIIYPKFDYGWKNKYIYYNKDDASIFVEKKEGIGYTINFANKIAIVIFTATILCVIGMNLGIILLIL